MTTVDENWKYLFRDEGRFLRKGPITLDLQAHSIILEDRYIKMPPCTFSYLVALARSAPSPVSYQQLVFEAQGREFPRLESQDIARMRIYMLRSLIGDAHFNSRYIVAVSGFGYRLNA